MRKKLQGLCVERGIEMEQIQHDKITAKLAKIKALAERGVGGEKETAMRMYEELKKKIRN